MTWKILQGDCRAMLATLPDASVQTCVTSPPYWGLRDYGVDGQLGLEQTPAEYVDNMVAVFREVRRVLRDDGTLWLNLGDSYARSGGSQGGGNREMLHMEGKQRRMTAIPSGSGLKPKDLVGIPWLVAFALRADGWFLRMDVIWHKTNPMPESVTDRPTKAHEYVFLMSKSERYYYDADAIKEPVSGTAHGRGHGVHPKSAPAGSGIKANSSFSAAVKGLVDERNKRSVWTVATESFSGAHFATFPTALIAPCLLAGAPVGGVVLDPFNGAGTTGVVATRLQRSYVGIELNPEYVEMSRRRIEGDAPLFNLASGE